MALKRIIAVALLWITLIGLTMSGCQSNCAVESATEDVTYWLNMNTDYPADESLPDGLGKSVKVILLLGQSNATGSSITAYLEKNISREQFAYYENGFESVKINYCLDDHNATSDGRFLPVDLTCGATDGFFGPEVGMAEVLSEAFPNETVYILKYTMSGYSLHHHWLCGGQRGSVYEACMRFLTTHLEDMKAKNYEPRIGAICWMQGESDTTDFKASHYYDNQVAFVSYLREDLAAYAEESGICFIDAGISNSPYCEPAYPAINQAKEDFSKLSDLNLYFSTIDMGLTIHKEPEGEPDWGHYDSLSELELGRKFGQLIVGSYAERPGK
ncbi:MAG: sialate O-acetylesterase [Ruminococcaceae bacterium]|nr:sialate O-acetylesterase [Oscillospiraceae bacterium]